MPVPIFRPHFPRGACGVGFAAPISIHLPHRTLRPFAWRRGETGGQVGERADDGFSIFVEGCLTTRNPRRLRDPRLPDERRAPRGPRGRWSCLRSGSPRCGRSGSGGRICRTRTLSAADFFGFASASADFNGDGVDDLATGVPESRGPAPFVNGCGQVVVRYGVRGRGLDRVSPPTVLGQFTTGGAEADDRVRPGPRRLRFQRRRHRRPRGRSARRGPPALDLQLPRCRRRLGLSGFGLRARGHAVDHGRAVDRDGASRIRHALRRDHRLRLLRRRCRSPISSSACPIMPWEISRRPGSCASSAARGRRSGSPRCRTGSIRTPRGSTIRPTSTIISAPRSPSATSTPTASTTSRPRCPARTSAPSRPPRSTSSSAPRAVWGRADATS